MTIRLQEVVRSDVEGGLSGPANPIPSQSIDCGCGLMQCPKLARFATRKLFVGLMCWVGVVQAASYVYFYVTGPTIARKFQINPYLMDWILVTADLTPFVLGLVVAYWGDRIHRTSWMGTLILLQSVAYFILIIPHLTHRVRVIEDTTNATYMSLYADDSSELCAAGTSKMIAKEDGTCYFTMVVLIIVLIISGMANVAYYALGISYLDDNTKKRDVTSFIGAIIAMRIMSIIFGYSLAWGCLRIDAENLNKVESYRDHIGAWWLGFPILSVLMVVPGLLLAWFPRRLPSEVVEQAAASLLDRSAVHNRAPHRTTNQKAGSPDFCPSFLRLITNKILMCNILAMAFCAMALLNFMTHEDIYLESRFHIARPTGMLLGFNDPLRSRLIINISKPVLIGLIVIISGLVLAKAKPSARFIIGYSFATVLLSIVIIILLIFDTCEKPPIVNMEPGSIGLSRYCNKNCGCSKDAVFRPVCEKLGKYTYYNPCYAGCTTIIYVDNEKIYSDCKCVEDRTGWSNDQATDGPCDSLRCQAAWMLFQFGTSVAYALIASTFVGDLLINVRSVYKQDKAISIGLWMAIVAIFVNVPGKILYEFASYQACQYWGKEKIICHLHDGEKLGNYLCYLTILLLSLCLVLKAVVCFFSKNLQLYDEVESEGKGNVEIQELIEQARTLDEPEEASVNNMEATVEPESTTSPETTLPEENPRKEDEDSEETAAFKYGPLGPGDRRSTVHPVKSDSQGTIQNLDSEDELDSSSDESRPDESKKQSSPRVAYTPLELDSDIESDLSSTGPRSRRRVSSKDYDQTCDIGDDNAPSKNSSVKRRFPNPDHYEDPRRARNGRNQNGYGDGSWKTTSFEFSTRGQESDVLELGNFNEVGIPIADPFPDGKGDSAAANTAHSKDVKSLIDQYEQNASQEAADEDQLSVKSSEDTRTRPENKIVSGIPLVAMVPGVTKQSFRRMSPSGSAGSPNLRDKNADRRSEKHTTPSPKSPAKGGKPTYCTDL
ncbi:PREDICTED: solute carrier organic anion transporter family member 1A5 [Dinoponera quadriceps]|uniref:Solute carrier organic anion transporter family member 1A5 n=1 Tax=Dinoponera quadriceps TaxID=609295 RepID=A0A6P3XW61_DINQU|nr:PREDICTED: solute carrier organic anion transporter family member 1A5 [Dinoponera quadriceps]